VRAVLLFLMVAAAVAVAAASRGVLLSIGPGGFAADQAPAGVAEVVPAVAPPLGWAPQARRASTAAAMAANPWPRSWSAMKAGGTGSLVRWFRTLPTPALSGK
jgi:hypothetical protein